MTSPPPLSFFDRPTLTVARELIGCYLCLKRKGKAVRYVITETEAYDGLEDLASHAARGKTKRNEVMFREAGHIYLYFCYGIHWLLNIVTGPVHYPAAVLIRGVQTVDGKLHYDGPAKLTKALGLTGSLNGKIVSKETGLWIEPRNQSLPEPRILTTPRIGVNYAGPIWSKKEYRFLLI